MADPVLRAEHRKPRPRGTGLRQVSKQKLKKPEETRGNQRRRSAPPGGAPGKPGDGQTAIWGWFVFQALVLALTCHILSLFSTHLDHFSFSGSCFLALHI